MTVRGVRLRGAALAGLLALAAGSLPAQTTVTNTETGETIVIDGPPLEAPLAVSLFRYLNQGEPGDTLWTRFEHTGPCLYRMTLNQVLDGGAQRSTVTDFDVRTLLMDGFEERTYAPNVAELVLSFAEGTGQTARVSLTGADAALVEQYRQSLPMTCEGETCVGDYQTPTLHLTVLTPSAENDLGFTNMAMGALMNACRPQQ